MEKITAVIVARKESERIPNKMHQKIGDETMVMRKVRQCLAVDGIGSVIVGSDDESIKSEVEAEGAIFAHREDKYCDEKSATVNEMVKNMLSFFESEYVLWAHPTNPFITTKHYSDAMNSLILRLIYDGYDSLFSASEMKGHFWREERQEIIPINFSPLTPIHKTANKLPAMYSQNGGIFIRKYEDMAKDGNLIGGKPVMYTISMLDGWDIDEQWQLELAQLRVKYGRDILQ